MKFLIVALCFGSAFMVASAEEIEIGCSKKVEKFKILACCDTRPKFINKDLIKECNIQAYILAPPAEESSEKPHENATGLISHFFKYGPPCETMKCVGNKFNIITPENKMNVTAFKTFIADQYDAKWNPIIEKSIEVCEKETADAPECQSAVFMGCIKHQMFTNCPQDEWSSGPVCDAIKTHFIKCNKPITAA